jgi:hypothetical protein
MTDIEPPFLPACAGIITGNGPETSTGDQE